MAEYFETPDLDSNRGWRGIGNINWSRYRVLEKNIKSGSAGTLQSLIANDKRIRNSRTATAAYAEAWAWTYYLIRWKPKEYTSYLQMFSAKRRLVWDDPETRLAEFRSHFGPDLEALQTDFLKRMGRLK